MAVHQVFGDKGGLVREMFLAGFERLATAFAAVRHTSDPIADLLVLGHAYRANRHLYELMFGRPFPEFQPDAEAAAQIQPTFDMLIAASRAAYGKKPSLSPSPLTSPSGSTRSRTGCAASTCAAPSATPPRPAPAAAT